MAKPKAKYGVLVCARTNFRFVTKVDDTKSEAYWTDGEDALQFASKTYAEDLARGLCLNGYPTMVVTIPNFIEDLKNPVGD